jgi:hypothetical protein
MSDRVAVVGRGNGYVEIARASLRSEGKGMMSVIPKSAPQHHGPLEGPEYHAIRGHLEIRNMDIHLEYMAVCTVNVLVLLVQLAAAEENAL